MLKHNSVLTKMEQDEEEDLLFILEQINVTETKEDKIYYGKGNAKSGHKAKYLLYPPSNIFRKVLSNLYYVE